MKFQWPSSIIHQLVKCNQVMYCAGLSSNVSRRSSRLESAFISFFKERTWMHHPEPYNQQEKTPNDVTFSSKAWNVALTVQCVKMIILVFYSIGQMVTWSVKFRSARRCIPNAEWEETQKQCVTWIAQEHNTDKTSWESELRLRIGLDTRAGDLMSIRFKYNSSDATRLVDRIQMVPHGDLSVQIEAIGARLFA